QCRQAPFGGQAALVAEARTEREAGAVEQTALDLLQGDVAIDHPADVHGGGDRLDPHAALAGDGGGDHRDASARLVVAHAMAREALPAARRAAVPLAEPRGALETFGEAQVAAEHRNAE